MRCYVLATLVDPSVRPLAAPVKVEMKLRPDHSFFFFSNSFPRLPTCFQRVLFLCYIFEARSENTREGGDREGGFSILRTVPGLAKKVSG